MPLINIIAPSNNIKTFCINLNSSSTPVIEHIFGKGRFRVLHDIARLADVLSDIYKICTSLIGCLLQTPAGI